MKAYVWQRYLDSIAICLDKLGNYNDSLDVHQNVLKIKSKFIGDNHVSIAGTYGNIGNVLQAQG